MDNIKESVTLAWIHAKKVLLTPSFDMKKWLLFGLVFWLAGMSVVKYNIDGSKCQDPGVANSCCLGPLVILIVYVVIFLWMQISKYDFVLKKQVDFSEAWYKHKGKIGKLFWFNIGVVLASVVPASIAGLVMAASPLVSLILLIPALLFCLLFIGIANYIVVPSLLRLPDNVSLFKIQQDLLGQSFKSNFILYLFLIYVFDFIASVLVNGLIFPLYIALQAMATQNFMVAIGLFLLIGAVFSIVLYPFFGVFLCSFHMAFTSKIFPGEYALLIPVYDGYANIIDSKTIYEIEAEDKAIGLQREQQESYSGSV